MAEQLYQATETWDQIGPDGEDSAFRMGKTRVPEGHWALDAFPDRWEPVDATNRGVEQATAAPGEKRRAGVRRRDDAAA